MDKIFYKKGDRVKIYADPITKKKLEGEAILREFCGKSDGPAGIESWKVNFIGDYPDDIVVRAIKP